MSKIRKPSRKTKSRKRRDSRLKSWPLLLDRSRLLIFIWTSIQTNSKFLSENSMMIILTPFKTTAK